MAGQVQRGCCVLLAVLLAPATVAGFQWDGEHAKPATRPGCHEVSTSFGDHMVLQRAPERSVIYGSVCGGLAGASSVSVSIDGGAETTVAIAKGAESWQVQLPAQPGGLTPHTVTVKAGSGSFSTTLSDVLFGDAILCSGQSVSSAPTPPGC